MRNYADLANWMWEGIHTKEERGAWEMTAYQSVSKGYIFSDTGEHSKCLDK